MGGARPPQVAHSLYSEAAMRPSDFAPWILPSPPGRRPLPRAARPHRRLSLERLDDRIAPAILTLSSNGVLTYAAVSGVQNNLTISHDSTTHTYTFVDGAEAGIGV